MNNLIISEVIPSIEEALTVSTKDSFDSGEVGFDCPSSSRLMHLVPTVIAHLIEFQNSVRSW